jgi:hypothetical protein
MAEPFRRKRKRFETESDESEPEIKKKTIETRVRAYAAKRSHQVKYDAKVFDYVFKAVLLYFQEKYNKSIEIVFDAIFVDCKDKKVIPFFSFISEGLQFHLLDDINMDTATNKNNWMKELVDICAEIITKSPKELIIFPLTFTGHQNVVIFRKTPSSLEWYEPNGNTFHCATPIILLITTFLTTLKDKLEQIRGKTIQTYFTNQKKIICSANNIGPQLLQAQYSQKRRDEHGKCILWTLLFIEQAIKAPRVTSKSFMNRIHRSFYTGDKKEFFHKISVGFMTRVDDILESNFHVSIKNLTSYTSIFIEFENNQQDPMKYLEDKMKYLEDKMKILEDKMKILKDKDEDKYFDSTKDEMKAVNFLITLVNKRNNIKSVISVKKNSKASSSANEEEKDSTTISSYDSSSTKDMLKRLEQQQIVKKNGGNKRIKKKPTYSRKKSRFVTPKRTRKKKII